MRELDLKTTIGAYSSSFVSEELISTVLKEDNLLASSILERHFFSYFRKGKKKLEIFLKGDCSANCEYCYLKKNRKYLYPIDISSFDTIIHNFELLINWYIENNFTCPLDFFSGSWIDTPYFKAVFDILYDKFSVLPSIKRPRLILIPDNMQFIKKENVFEEVISTIEKFKTLGIRVCFSASIDGKYCDDGRTKNDDDFYKKLFDFMEKYDFRAHPMVSSSNSKNWIQNYKWWIEESPKSVSDNLMMLEVRNNDWTSESISDLLNFLNYRIDYVLNEEFNGDKLEFLRYVLGLKVKDKIKNNGEAYNNIKLFGAGEPFTSRDDEPNCSLGSHSLMVRAGDLSIFPCHRTSYEELKIGHFSIENDKITEFIADNVSLFMIKTAYKRSCTPHCSDCIINGDFCTGFCSGAAYEVSHNLFCPPMTVCNMYKAKVSFLLEKYCKLGLIEFIDTLDEKELSLLDKKRIIDVSEQILGNLNKGTGC